MLAQDLHIHTIWSSGDGAVVPEQTVELIAQIRHARVVGISDHFEYLVDGFIEAYVDEVRRAGLHSAPRSTARLGPTPRAKRRSITTSSIATTPMPTTGRWNACSIPAGR